MARPNQTPEPLTDDELAAFERAMRDQRERILEDLAEATDRTPEEIREAVAEYEMPDPDEMERIPAEEFYGEE